MSTTTDLVAQLSPDLSEWTSQLESLVSAATGVNYTALRLISGYLIFAGCILFAYKLYVALLILKATQKATDKTDVFRGVIAMAALLVLPYSTGAWLVDTVWERSKARIFVSVTYVTLILIGAYFQYISLAHSRSLHLDIPFQ